jgi:hypothetical protein
MNLLVEAGSPSFNLRVPACRQPQAACHYGLISRLFGTVLLKYIRMNTTFCRKSKTKSFHLGLIFLDPRASSVSV